jgi:hypothetical protein
LPALLSWMTRNRPAVPMIEVEHLEPPVFERKSLARAA